MSRRIRATVLVSLGVILFIVGIYAPVVVEILSKGVVMRYNNVFLGSVSQGTVINHRFELWNISLKPLTIMLAEPTCTCSSVKANRYHLPPFGKSIIRIVVDTGELDPGRQGSGVVLRLQDGRRASFVITFRVVGEQEREMNNDSGKH